MKKLGPDLPGMKCLELLGSGGFSDVYLYERDMPRLKVAVKLLRADALDEAQRRQFSDEAESMAELAEHPFIVPVLGAGEAPDGRPYLVMRYYPPPDLGERVAAEPLDVADALRTGIQLASAVETAHRAGIIHRDIKPANVLISSYGVPGLTDFGIAGRGDHADASDDHVGVSMPWSPPEVLTGQSNGSAASDIYSLAATIWNLLAGRSPFVVRGGNNSEREIFTRILHAKVPSLGRADVPSSLERLLQQAMAKQPDQRPGTALELARHLQRVEQELKLNRTDIVVVDSPEAPPAPGPAPQAAPASSAAPAPAPVERDQGDVTMRRRPPTVNAQAPVAKAPERADLTVRRPVTAHPEVASAASADVTMHRPRMARTSEAGPAVAAPPPGPPPRTVPRAAGDVPADDAEALEPPAKPGSKVIGIMVGVLLIAAVGVGVAFATSGKDGTPTSVPSPTAPSGPDDVIDDFAPLLAPQIAISRTATKVTFTATVEGGGQLTWQVDSGSGFHPATGTAAGALAVPWAQADRICIRVSVRRDGAISDPADRCAQRP